MPNGTASAAPSTAPAANIVVTSPPINPAPSVAAVNKIFTAQSNTYTFSPENAVSISEVPKPAYLPPVRYNRHASMTPAASARTNGFLTDAVKNWRISFDIAEKKSPANPKIAPKAKILKSKSQLKG